MSNIKKLFSERIDAENKKHSVYNKYIFNSHIVMFSLFVFGAILFNYSSWLQSTSKVNIAIVGVLIFLIMTYFLTTIKIKTFIKFADPVFILPIESQYSKIKNKIIIPTIILKGGVSAIFVGLLYPLVSHLGYSKKNLIFLLASLIMTNVFISALKQHKVVFSALKKTDIMLITLSYILNGLWFAFTPYANLTFLFVWGLYLLLVDITSQNRLNWSNAAEYDEVRKAKYLKIVNMFTDVPINSIKTQRRKYLDLLVRLLVKKGFTPQNAYDYYYVRSFLRQENSIFLVVRLFVVAILFVVGLNNVYSSAASILIFNYLSVTQMNPIFKKINENLWLKISPVNDSYKLISFSQLINKLLFGFSLILGIASILTLEVSTINISLIVASILLSWLINSKSLRNLKN